MQMSDIDNKNFKTAYDNAVFLSGGRQTGGVQPDGRLTVDGDSLPDADGAELCALRETLPVGGIAFGDATELITDFILNHFNVFAIADLAEKSAGFDGKVAGSDEKFSDGAGVVGSWSGEAVIFTDDFGYFSRLCCRRKFLRRRKARVCRSHCVFLCR